MTREESRRKVSAIANESKWLISEQLKVDNDRLDRLIRSIPQLKVRHPDILKEALLELKAVVGMDKLKASIVSQVQYLIKRPDARKMLSVVLYGPPGTGKTTVGTILAKIYYSLGYLDEVETSALETVNMEFFLYFIIGAVYVIPYLSTIAKKIYTHYGLKALLLISGLIIFILVLLLVVKPKKTTVKSDSLIQIVSRDDFVAGYVGQTALKTKKLLKASKGKVLFIDEAYSLLHDSQDSFGMEALTAINLYLSQNPRTAIIWGGYRDLMEEGIFKAQPGLARRCMWHFECSPYNGDQLYTIFKRQVQKDGYDIDDDIKAKGLLKESLHCFPNYGGDTERLTFYTQIEHADDNLGRNEDKTLTSTQIERGLKSLCENQINVKKSDRLHDLLARAEAHLKK